MDAEQSGDKGSFGDLSIEVNKLEDIDDDLLENKTAKRKKVKHEVQALAKKPVEEEVPKSTSHDDS